VLFRARRLLLKAGVLLEDAAFRVEHGRIAEILENPGRSSAKSVDLDEGLVAPGFVNAHAHLELGGAAFADGALEGSSMVAWIRGMIEARRERRTEDYVRAWRAGSERLLATGTTSVGDIDASGACEAEGPEAAVGVVCYREVLDAGDPSRVPSAMRRVQRSLSPRRGFLEGLSPHAPYTTSPELLASCGKLQARRSMPLAVHWAEIPEEEAWVRRGGGPLGELLERRTPSPEGSLELLERNGLLDGRTALIHANHPEPADVERIRRSGAIVVHCPGTHRFFGRASFPLEAYLRAGIPIALGTDSLASNEDLDMGREMQLARASLGALPASETLRWATEGGALALGLGDRVGRLEAGLDADFVHHAHEPGDAEEAALMLASPAQVFRTWVRGREAWSKQNV